MNEVKKFQTDQMCGFKIWYLSYYKKSCLSVDPFEKKFLRTKNNPLLYFFI